MPIAPLELQCVPADGFDILQHDQQGHIVGLQPPYAGPFVDASRTWTMQSEVPNRVDCMMPIAPLDPKDTLIQPRQVFWFQLSVGHLQNCPLTVRWPYRPL